MIDLKTKYSVLKIWMIIFYSIILAPSFSQNENTDLLYREFKTANPPTLQEKLFIQTDKTFYLPGEIIWLKIYEIDGILNKPLPLSKVAYVEILNQENKPILQVKIDLDNSMGKGSILIPKNIETGNYTLRAYTQWMKNFSADFYFHQPLTIVNTWKPSNFDAIKKISHFDIQFFPEGGDLVTGLTSKVAFKITNEYNESLNCKGVLLNQKKDTILSFSTVQFGMGSFQFTPKKNDTYFAVIQLKDTIITKKLPAIFSQGYVMQVADADTAHIKIAVRSNINSKYVYLLVQSHQILKSVQSNIFLNGETNFLINKEKLADGISTFTILNSDKQPVCERLYFKRPVNSLRIQVITDKKSYTTRSNVNVELSTMNNKNKIADANLSLSVFQINTLQSPEYQDILSYVYLSSELKGKIESPAYYFNNPSNEVAENLMLTQGWRRFKWNASSSVFNFISELEGMIIKVKILDKRNNLPAKNIMSYLSIPGKNYQFANAVSDSSGNVIFNVNKFYGHHSIVVQTNNQIDSNYRIDIETPFSDQYAKNSSSPFYLSTKWKDDLLQRSINVQVDNAFKTDEKHAFLPTEINDTLPFYGIPDKKYYLDDYTRFLTMEEVMREYVSDVMVRLQSGNFNFKVWNEKFNSYFDDNPLVLIDGIPVFNINKIVAFDPLKVKKIEVVAKKYYLSSLLNEGIITYSTYNGDLAGFELDPNSIVVEYEGLQKQREFYAPVYATTEDKENRLPDCRNVLIWKPDITFDANGKTKLNFYSSDLKGTFMLLVQGISKDGLCGSALQSFEVK